MFQADSHPYFHNQGPLVFAHRGGCRLAPENTMVAFRGAFEMGADVFELDVRGTADGTLVVIHDEIVDRITNGSGRVNDLSLESVKQLDAGYHWTADNGKTYPFRGQGLTIPTLEELFMAFPKQRMNIDIKQKSPSIIQPFGRMVTEFGTDKVLVASFEVSNIRAFRRAFPRVLTAADARESMWMLLGQRLGFVRLLHPEGRAFQLPERQGPIRVLTPAFVRALHRRHFQVHMWTVNHLAHMRRLIHMGVDGLITGRPDLMLELLGRGTRVADENQDPLPR